MKEHVTKVGFHVYHNNCAPRYFDTLEEAETYAEQKMNEDTHCYNGTNFIKMNSIMTIKSHAMFNQHDPYEIIIYENMYNLEKIKENNLIYYERQLVQK